MKQKWFLRWLTPLLLALPLLLMTRTALAALGITGVQPGTVQSGTASQIAITGTDFVTGTVALLDGFGVLDTTYVAPTLLTAALPASVPPGVYTVRVIAPDGTQASLANALTVVGPTATPLPSATPQDVFTRPQLIVVSYGASSPQIAPGENYDFEMTIQNAGSDTATNIVAEFAEGDFLPRVTGGIRAVGSLTPGQTARFFQPLYAVRELSQKKVASLEVKITYNTAAGETFTDTFTLTFPVVQPGVGGTVQPTATPTPRAIVRPQMVVKAYHTDVEQLAPGTQFVLQVEVQNVGNATARRLSMIVGGGTADVGSGTPTGPGGVSGGGGSFTDFAPVQSSNVQSLNDLPALETITANQPLIVNSATKAGAYPLKLSFVYVDERGQTYVDDQVITLLVFQTPQVEINFYRDPGPLFANQPNQLPIQLVNLGRQTALFGNMRVTAEVEGEFSNNVLLVGSLDPGNTFPLDATFTPFAAGPTELVVTVDYTDDFNQPQKITAQLTVEVLEGFPTPEPGGEIPGGEIPGGELPLETTTEMFVRFLRGLFGFGSARPQPTLGFFPVENFDNGGGRLEGVPVP